MDKLIHEENGSVTISNDGATLMKKLQVVHPAANTLVQISMSQDAEVGDGTTSVVLLAGEFLREAKPFIEEGVHPQVIIKAYREAVRLATEKLDELAVNLDHNTPEEVRTTPTRPPPVLGAGGCAVYMGPAWPTLCVSVSTARFHPRPHPWVANGPCESLARRPSGSAAPANTLARPATHPPPSAALQTRAMLEKAAATSLNSKLVSGHKHFFAKMVVDAVLSLDPKTGLDMLGSKKVVGGSLQDSMLVDGVAFKKTFSYAGFEQMTKYFKDPKIVLLNVELELKAERDNAEVRVADVAAYQQVVDAEWDIIYDKLAKIVASGANIVLSKLAIGDLATQYFADRGLFCAGRVEDGDLRKVAKATNAQVQTSCNDLCAPDVLGTCGTFEEKQVGGERFNFFKGCPGVSTCTFILRGGAEQFIEEAERSLHDAIMNTRRLLKNPSIIAGGGAIEMELSAFLREKSRHIYGKQQLLIGAYAKSLEVIPRQVAANSGMDPTDVLNKLRMKHAHGEKWYGVDVVENGVCDTMEAFVWEATVMKRNALAAATEAACLILSVDETVRNPASEQPDKGNYPGKGGKGRGGGRFGRGRGRGR